MSEFAGFSDYHALQTSLTRRYSSGLQVGMAYTLASSKTTSGTVNPFLDTRSRNYASVGRRHNLAVNYAYEIPGGGLQHAAARALLGGWEISGVTSALSGAALPLSYSIQGVSDLTGGAGTGVDTRVDIVCDPNLSRGDRTPSQAFRTECIAPPAFTTGYIGTARGDELIGPGYLNWDISLTKNVPLGGLRRLLFRVELYNAFNTVQFSTVNTSAVFNRAGAQVNGEFGQYIAARDARRIQLTARVQF